MRRAFVCFFVTSAAALATAPAAAQEPGVVYDPDSPAGKEYALPLDAARNAAAPVGRPGGDTRQPASPEQPARAPLFGEGITPKRVKSSSRGTGAPTEKPREGEGGETGRYPGASTPSTREEQRSESADRIQVAQSRSSNGPSSLLVSTIVALAVLLVGGGLGFGGRRLRRGTP